MEDTLKTKAEGTLKTKAEENLDRKAMTLKELHSSLPYIVSAVVIFALCLCGSIINN
ncbi:MAG: hypothetical protein K5864_00905 [Bacteroidales bacterium]|nr:hypothetical protein [Bacteroidales bacterium]